MAKNKNTIIVGAIVILVVLAIGYFTFFREPSPENQAITTTSGVLGGAPVGQELVIELNRLKALRNLDTTIFADPSFLSLKDFTQPVPPLPVGRVNPFAPVGSDI